MTAYRLVVWDQGPDLMHTFCVERQRAAVYAAAWDRATVDDTDRTMYKADVYRALRSWFQERRAATADQRRPLVGPRGHVLDALGAPPRLRSVCVVVALYRRRRVAACSFILFLC